MVCPAVCYGVCERATAGCQQDTDCKTFSSYCDGCSCLALPVNAPTPKCEGKKVACVADPCMTKRVVCQTGRCALQNKPPQ